MAYEDRLFGSTTEECIEKWLRDGAEKPHANPVAKKLLVRKKRIVTGKVIAHRLTADLMARRAKKSTKRYEVPPYAQCTDEERAAIKELLAS